MQSQSNHIYVEVVIVMPKYPQNGSSVCCCNLVTLLISVCTNCVVHCVSHCISRSARGKLDTSPSCHFAPPISKFANSKFTVVIGHGLALTLNPNLKGLNPNPKYHKSQIKTLIPNLKSVTLCPNPHSQKSLTLSPNPKSLTLSHRFPILNPNLTNTVGGHCILQFSV